MKDEQRVGVGQRVGWTETYRTTNNCIAKRTEWGTVVEVFDYCGGSQRGGYPINGTYVMVDQSAYGRGLGAILVDDLHTVFPL